MDKPLTKAQRENEREVDTVIAAALEEARLIGEALKHASTWRWTTDTKSGD